MNKKIIKKAIFPVGGLGTRFLPVTKVMPKEMLPVLDKPLIHHAFEEAKKAGIEQFIFITGRNKNIIMDHFDCNNELEDILRSKGKESEAKNLTHWLPEVGNISFIRQREAKGLGHAIWCARHLINNEPFAVLLADDIILGKTPCISQLMTEYEKSPANIIGVESIDIQDSVKYGIIEPHEKIEEANERAIKVKSLVEKPSPEVAPSNIAIAGRYILQPDIMKYLDEAVNEHNIKYDNEKPNKNRPEIQITDYINRMCLDGTNTLAYRFEGKRYDCGSHLGFVTANLAYALRNKDISEKLRHEIQNLIKYDE